MSAVFGGRILIASRAPDFLSFTKSSTRFSIAKYLTIPTTMTAESKKQYWLLKTEPTSWSWEDQAANCGISNWDGVKNKQAQKNLKAMKLGERCFFYHSGTKSRCIVGVVEVVKEWYLGEDGEGVVDVKEVGEMRRRVGLQEIKEDEGIRNLGFQLLRQPRLSVAKVAEEVWVRVCGIGGGFVGDGREEVDEDEGLNREAGED